MRIGIVPAICLIALLCLVGCERNCGTEEEFVACPPSSDDSDSSSSSGSSSGTSSSWFGSSSSSNGQASSGSSDMNPSYWVDDDADSEPDDALEGDASLALEVSGDSDSLYPGGDDAASSALGEVGLVPPDDYGPAVAGTATGGVTAVSTPASQTPEIVVRAPAVMDFGWVDLLFGWYGYDDKGTGGGAPATGTQACQVGAPVTSTPVGGASRLSALNSTEAGLICDALAASRGGYGSHVCSCPSGAVNTRTMGGSRADCVSRLAIKPTCPVSVEQLLSCENSINAHPCEPQKVFSTGDCRAVAACA